MSTAETRPSFASGAEEETIALPRPRTGMRAEHRPLGPFRVGPHVRRVECDHKRTVELAVAGGLFDEEVAHSGPGHATIHLWRHDPEWPEVRPSRGIGTPNNRVDADPLAIAPPFERWAERCRHAPQQVSVLGVQTRG
jgi:hypothetical protein